MNFEEFDSGIREYGNYEYAVDYAYNSAYKRRDVWDNLENLSENDTINVILDFLNKWKCRISYGCSSSLCGGLRNLSNSIEKLRNCKIETLDFEKDDTIEKIFDSVRMLLPSGAGASSTGASKLLHMTIPQLFPMWDAKIRKIYRCSGDGKGYVNFMLRMKHEREELLRDFADKNNIDIKEAEKKIIDKYYNGNKPLLKLIDEYVYMNR